MKKLQCAAMLFLMIPTLLLSGCGYANKEDVVLAQKIVAYEKEKYDKLPVSGRLIEGTRVVEIQAYQFYFEPATVVVNKGEKIRLIISAEDVPHGFEIEGIHIDGYDIETVIRKGFPLTLEFTADEEGIWDMICTIYCGFGHSTMKGTFIVRGESNAGMEM